MAERSVATARGRGLAAVSGLCLGTLAVADLRHGRATAHPGLVPAGRLLSGQRESPYQPLPAVPAHAGPQAASPARRHAASTQLQPDVPAPPGTLLTDLLTH